jgi:RNA polymerase sigma-70 factor (ECF subfamily)
VERSASEAQASRDGGTARDFTPFYAGEYRQLLALALGLSATRAEAEEHVQDALAIAYRSWDTVQFLESPGGWTRRVLLNRLASAHRRSLAERRGILRLMPQPLTTEASPGDAELWAAVRRLPARQAQSVALHYIEDRPVAEIAEILGVGVSTVKIHLQRGRAAIGRSLGIGGGS